MLTEYGVQYERTADPTMDNPSGVVTVVQLVKDEYTARMAVEVGAPLSGRNHRVVTRQITEWVDCASKRHDPRQA